MRREQLEATVREVFGELLHQFEEGEEYGFTLFGHPNRPLRRVAYAVSLTPETAAEAVSSYADLILTHHDAWDFMHGAKEQCHAILQRHGISHCFVHLPLDYADFGTCASLFRAIGIAEPIQASCHWHGRSIPGVGRFERPLTFAEARSRLEAALEEPVAAWRHHDRPIVRVGIVTGAGHASDCLRDADEAGCDLYITGEKSLYTIQYARQIGMNLLIGSHTFTERPGIRAFAERLRDRHPDLELIELREPHDEWGHDQIPMENN